MTSEANRFHPQGRLSTTISNPKIAKPSRKERHWSSIRSGQKKGARIQIIRPVLVFGAMSADDCVNTIPIPVDSCEGILLPLHKFDSVLETFVLFLLLKADSKALCKALTSVPRTLHPSGNGEASLRRNMLPGAFRLQMHRVIRVMVVKIRESYSFSD